MVMTRKQALDLLKTKLQNQNLFKHCLAVEAVMRGLARHFHEDEEVWGLTGLLHDIDYQETRGVPEKHSLIGAEILAKQGLPPELVYAVKVHNEVHGLPRISKIDKALFCTDPITGLIVATALVMPNKKLAEVRLDNILNRYKEKGFARGANREHIALCSELGSSLEEFIKIGLEAMKSIAQNLGL